MTRTLPEAQHAVLTTASADDAQTIDDLDEALVFEFEGRAGDGGGVQVRLLGDALDRLFLVCTRGVQHRNLCFG